MLKGVIKRNLLKSLEIKVTRRRRLERRKKNVKRKEVTKKKVVVVAKAKSIAKTNQRVVNRDMNKIDAVMNNEVVKATIANIQASRSMIE